MLIEAKADIDNREFDEMTPLIAIVSRNYYNIVEHLLVNGTNANLSSKKKAILNVAKTQKMKQIPLSHINKWKVP